MSHRAAMPATAFQVFVVVATLFAIVGTYGPTSAAIRFDSPLLTQVGGANSQQHPDRPVVADLNGDGLLDVVIHNPSLFSDSLAILFGRGDGTLAPPLSVSTPGGSSCI